MVEYGGFGGFTVCVRNIDRIRAHIKPVKNTVVAQALILATAENGVLWELPTEADLPALAWGGMCE